MLYNKYAVIVIPLQWSQAYNFYDFVILINIYIYIILTIKIFNK